MGNLIRSFTYDRNVVKATLDESANALFSVLKSDWSADSVKIDANILTAAGSYMGLIDLPTKGLTAFGNAVMQYAKIDEAETFRWVLTRSLEKYQLPNGTHSPNNEVYTDAGIIFKPLKWLVSVCSKISILDKHDPFVTFKELCVILNDDANWALTTEQISELIIQRRIVEPVSTIANGGGSNSLLELEKDYGVSRDNLNGFFGKTCQQTGLFQYEKRGKTTYGIGVALNNPENNWFKYIMENNDTWDQSVHSWDEYIMASAKELPRPEWMLIPPILLPIYISLKKNGLFYEFRTVKRYIAALAARNFVVLAGNSGTGKSRLCTELADVLKSDRMPFHAILEVGANWKSNDPIIGYYDSLAVPSPRHLDAEVLQLLKNAEVSDNKNKPHFITLDEMNLSHVEWYFSDFLSVMEREGNKRKIRYSKDGTPGSGDAHLGSNVFISGTVNVDQTTYSFSPKVLDRAHIIEVPTLPPAILAGGIPSLPNLDPTIEDSLNDQLANFLVVERPRAMAQSLAGTIWGRQVIVALSQIWEKMKSGGFEFGPRVTSDILIYMDVVRELAISGGGEDWKGPLNHTALLALDEAICQKVLTKIQGQRGILEDLIEDTIEILKNILAAIIDQGETVLCLDKLKAMQKQLQTGYTSFLGS